MRHFRAHRCFSLTAIILTGILPAAQSIPGAEVTEPNDIVHTTFSVRSEKDVDFDLAKLNAHARVVYTSSGVIALRVRMIDDSVGTAFRFSGLDLHPTVIVKLAQSELLHQVSVSYQTGAARLDVYLLNAMPKNPGNLSALTPIASIVDLPANGETTVDFAPTGARYIAFQWTRDKTSSESFDVAEISAFTVGSHTQTQATLADLGNGQTQPTDLPIIPVVSPD